MKKNYSVLMSVYKKEKPEYLYEAMKSIFSQTIMTDDFVLVCDGELTEELYKVISKFRESCPEVLKIVQLPQNEGLGRALDIGLKHCKNTLVARMDSDDISLPERCQKQLKVFAEHPENDVVSGFVAEFEDDEKQINRTKTVPEQKADIYSYAKRRNPVNHPCVMYRKDSVLKAGSYQSFYLLEDYFLWIRMMEKNMNFYNIQEVLLKMRANQGMYQRRGSLKYFNSIFRLRRYMKNVGFSGYKDFFITITGQFIICILPNAVRRILYKNFLRNQTVKKAC